MAVALRKVWLEPETVAETHAPTLKPHRRRHGLQLPWLRMTLPVLLVAFLVGGGITFVSSYAHIAEAQIRGQVLRQEYASLNRECVGLNLELARLASQPRLEKVAEARGLALPDANRLHYVHVTDRYPNLSSAHPDAPAQRPAWLAQTGTRLVAALGNAWSLMGGGPDTQAYAHE